MNHNQIILTIVLSALLIYLVIAIKKRPTTLLTLFIHSVGGLSYIYLFNSFCAAREIVTGLGVNPITIALSVFLGIPGAMLGFGINLLQFIPAT